MSDASGTVAAFDWDGTLTRVDTVAPFLRRVAGARALLAATLRDAPALAAVLAGRGDRDAAKARLLARLLTGRRRDEVEEAGRAYARLVARRGLRADVAARVREHLAAGHEVVIVSASLDAYLVEAARLLGVDTVLCTRLEAGPDGVLTGRMEGGNCRGPEKAKRLADHLARRPGGPPGVLWAYGDSAGDAELLAMADRPVRVRRWPRPAGLAPFRA